MTVIFDFPLNEKVRSYLRIEQLIKRCESALPLEERASVTFFSHLFDLMDVLERSDLKQDMIKDLEAQSTELAKWASYPGVNLQKVSDLQQTVDACMQTVRGHGQQIAQLKQDKFLSSIRQRFGIPGGNCCFDLPQLHMWLAQPQQTQLEYCQRWLENVKMLSKTICLLLQLMRDSKHFQQVVARNGFFQECSECVQLVRIKVASDLGCYPTLSGNKHRFAIRFLSDQNGSNGNNGNLEQDIPFELASC